MAIEKVIDIKVNLGNSEKDVNNLGKAFGYADKEATNLDATFEEIYGDLKPLTARMGEQEDRLYELAKAGKQSSQEYKNLLKSVAEYKRVQQQTDLIVDASAETLGIKLSGSLSAVAGGFAILQGSIGLFGEQSEDVERTILKVQSAMAISQGIETIDRGVKSVKALGASLKATTIFQNASAIAQKIWNTAMNASPIGVLILAITSLIAVGATLINYFKTSSEETENNTKAVNANANALNNETKAMDRSGKEFDKRQKHQIEMAKASGKSADSIRELELKLIDEKIAFEKSARATAFNTYEKNKNYLATLKLADADEEVINKQQETVNKSIDAYNKQNQAVQSSFDEKKAIQLRHQVEIKQAETNHNEELRKKQQESNNKSKELQAEKIKQEAEALKKAQEDKIKQQEEWDKQARDKQIEDGYKAMDDIEASRKANADRLLTEQELAIQNENEAYQIKYDNAVKAGLDIEELEVDHLNRLNEINLTAQQKQYQDEKAISEAKIKIIELEAQAREALLSKTKDVLSRGADLLGKNTASGKAMAAAAALINTYQGITAELATKTVTPFEIGLKIANVAIIAGTGFKAVKDILSVKVPNSGGGGGVSAPSIAGISGGGASAPQFNVVGNAGTNQIAQTLANQNQTPIQTYVVASSVTTAQSLDRNIISNASIG